MTNEVITLAGIIRGFFKWCLRRENLQAYIDSTPEVKEFLSIKRKEAGEEALEDWFKEIRLEDSLEEWVNDTGGEGFKEIVDHKKQQGEV